MNFYIGLIFINIFFVNSVYITWKILKSSEDKKQQSFSVLLSGISKLVVCFCKLLTYFKIGVRMNFTTSMHQKSAC